MTANSFNGTVKTNGDFVTVESVTVGVSGSSFTGFTSEKVYNCYIGNKAYLKIGDYVVPVFNEKFDYKAGSDDLYIKTNYNTECALSILENEES